MCKYFTVAGSQGLNSALIKISGKLPFDVKSSWMCLQCVFFMLMWSEPAVLQEHLVHVKSLRVCER